MKQRRTLRALLAALTLAVAGAPAQAAYSGLTIIPTADALAPGEVCLDYQLYTPTAVGSGVNEAYLNTQVGVGNRAELGMDLDFTEDAPTGAVFNGKLVLRTVAAGLGLAVGSYNAGENLRPTSYLAASVEPTGRLRLHAGMQRTPEDDNQGFVGAEYELNERTWIWGEYLAGDENASAVTLSYQLSEHWGIAIAWQRPNDRDEDECLVFDLGCVRPAG